MSGNFAIKGGGVGPLMANAILNFHFDFPHTSLIQVMQVRQVHLWPDFRVIYSGLTIMYKLSFRMIKLQNSQGVGSVIKIFWSIEFNDLSI